jgi:hypothetical protein
MRPILAGTAASGPQPGRASIVLATACRPFYSPATRTAMDGVLVPGAENLLAGPTMHPFVHRPPGPLQVAEHAEQLSHQGGGGKLSLAFQGITAISLGVVTTKMLFDTVRKAAGTTHHTSKSNHGRER